MDGWLDGNSSVMNSSVCIFEAQSLHRIVLQDKSAVNYLENRE